MEGDQKNKEGKTVDLLKLLTKKNDKLQGRRGEPSMGEVSSGKREIDTPGCRSG